MLYLGIYNLPGGIHGNLLVAGYYHIARFGMNYILCCISPENSVDEWFNCFIAFPDFANYNPFYLLPCSDKAVIFTYYYILTYINQPPGEITRVCCSQSCIRKTLASSMGRNKEFKNRQSLTEIC